MSPAGYPPAPWRMHGSMWISAFRLATGDARHPRGVYAVALVDYAAPSPLTYRELLVARPLTTAAGTRAVTITDIWVDSPASQAGGRQLWAIPKQLCTFAGDVRRTGPLTDARWATQGDDGPIASARFRDVSHLAPRLPLKGFVEQPGIEDHPDTAHVTMAGSARMLPARGAWSFAAEGPLGFLAEARRLGSFRSVGFRLTFE